MITDDNQYDNNVIDCLENENMILKNQVCFLMECINNQMRNLETLCENSKNNFIHKEDLKPYYKKIYKCDIYINNN